MAREHKTQTKKPKSNAGSEVQPTCQKQIGAPVTQGSDVDDLPPPEPQVNKRKKKHNMTVQDRIDNIENQELAVDVQENEITCLHCFVTIQGDKRSEEGYYHSNWNQKHSQACRIKLLVGIKKEHHCTDGTAERIYQEWLILERALWPDTLNEILRTNSKPVKSPRRSRYRKPGAALVSKPRTRAPRTKAPKVVGASNNSPRDYNTLSSVTSPPSSQSASCSDLGACSGPRPGRKELHLNPLIPSESPSPSASPTSSLAMSFQSEGPVLYRPPLFAETEAVQRAHSAPAGQNLWPSLSATRCIYDVDPSAHSRSAGCSDIGQGWSSSMLALDHAFRKHGLGGTGKKGVFFRVGPAKW